MQDTNLKIKHVLYSLLAGLVFSFALPPKVLPGLEWIAFVPFLGILLFNFKKKRYYFYAGFLSGVVAMGKYLFWFFKAAPLIWIGISSEFWSLILIGLIWFLAIIYFAFWFGLFILFIKYIETGKIWDIFLIAFAWPVFEFLRTYFFNFYLPIIGTGSVIGDHWALGIFGYSLADYTYLRQWAAIGGDYFLSFILILFNALIFYTFWLVTRNKNLISINTAKLFFEKNYKELILIITILIIIFLVFIIGGKILIEKYFSQINVIEAAAIQLAFPVNIWSAPRYSSNVISLINTKFEAAVLRNPPVSLIVMPEGADITYFTNNSTNLKLIKNILGENYQVVVSGDFRLTYEDKAFLAIFDNNQGLIGVYAKQFLMPFGEYLPVIFKIPASNFFKNWVREFRWFSPGREPSVFKTQFGNVGILACSEIISPELIRQEAAQGAQVIAFSASDSIFRGSNELHSQNLAMAKIRAAETRRSIIYASNGEKSFIIDPLGNILWVAGDLDFQNGYAQVPLNSDLTPYDKFGDWFVYLSAVILLVWITLVDFLKFYIIKNDDE